MADGVHVLHEHTDRDGDMLRLWRNAAGEVGITVRTRAAGGGSASAFLTGRDTLALITALWANAPAVTLTDLLGPMPLLPGLTTLPGPDTHPGS